MRKLCLILVVVACVRVCFSEEQQNKDIEVSGKRQSPVNIDSKNAKKIQLTPLNFKNFDEIPFELNVTNTGESLQVSGVWEKWRIPTISGSNLKHQYKFVQFHFHWGRLNFFGSEHRLNNAPFGSELHAVFIRSDLDNFQNATHYPDGIVVIGYFISRSSKSDKTWHPLTQVVPWIKNASESINIRPSPINSFLKTSFVEYFKYDGSLTSPPYSENVQWIIVRNSEMFISPKQLDTYRSLLHEDGNPILTNRRQLQNLNNRIIYRVRHIFDNRYYY